MARTVKGSVRQQRTVACDIGQQILLLEQFRGVKNSRELLGTVLCEKQLDK